YPNLASNITIQHINLVTDGIRTRHDPTQRVALINWTQAGANTFFQTNFSGGGDLRFSKTLDFRIARRYSPALNGDLTSTTDFSMQLAMPNGTLSAPLKLSAYLDLRGPVGGAFGGNLHSILQTVRIPIGDFKDVDLSLISGLRFTFDRTPSGTIFLGNIRTMTVDDGVPLSLAGGPNLLPQAKQADNHSEGFHAVEGSTDQLATRTGSIKGV